MANEFIHGIGKCSVFVGIFDILHLRREIYALRCFFELQGNLCFIDRNEVFDDLRLLTALYGSSVEKMVYIAMLVLLVHEGDNALCREIGGNGLVFTEKKVKNVCHGLAGNERTCESIFGKYVECNVSAFRTDGDSRIILRDIVRCLRVAAKMFNGSFKIGVFTNADDLA